MLVVRVFDDAAAAAAHNRIVPNHNGVAELMKGVDPGLRIDVIGNLVRCVRDRLGVVGVGIP